MMSGTCCHKQFAQDHGGLSQGVSVRRTFVTVLVAAGLIAGGGTVPAQAAAQTPGSVVSWSPVTVPAPDSALATAVRLEYVTTDVRGAVTTATGLIFTPKNQSTRTRKTVVWAHGTTGLVLRGED